MQKIESSYIKSNNVIEREKSQIFSMYQYKSQINNINKPIDTQPQQKFGYEQYLILIDEQEKDLFKLSELKNQYSRQK
ncbi:unnamed protein product [Paramecium primaurelia]|uniref:Uncharacterized protein n=1 Tax=Paramecium primaurelia TaxID=5886 RepID=A0A8S1MDS8_PARPR|nr:unnamed protein product [Paramecium primaurelia]